MEDSGSRLEAGVLLVSESSRSKEVQASSDPKGKAVMVGVEEPELAKEKEEFIRSIDVSIPSIVFLMETKNKEAKLERIRRRLKFTNFAYVNPVGISGGLDLWWNDEFEVNVVKKDKNMINAKVYFSVLKLYATITWIYE